MRKLCLILLLCSFREYRSQDPNAGRMRKIDSIQKVLTQAPADTTRVRLINWQSNLYSNAGKNDEAIQKAKEALTLSTANNYNKGIASANYYLGLAYKGKEEYTTSIHHYTIALSVREKMNDPKGIANTCAAISNVKKAMGDYYGAKVFQTKTVEFYKRFGDTLELASAMKVLGGIYYEQGNYPEALNQYSGAFKTYESKSGYDKEKAGILNNIANIYLIMKKYDDAIETYLSALKLNEKIGNEKWKAVNLTNLGNSYGQKGDRKKAQEYLQEALDLRQKLNDKAGIGSTLLYMSINAENMEDLDKAIAYGERSLKIREEVHDKPGLASTMRSLGLVYGKKGNYKRSLELLEGAVEQAREVGSRQTMMEAYGNLCFIHEKMSDFKKANQYFKMQIDLKDSLLNAQNVSQMNRLGVEFESERKDAEIRLLNAENEKKEAVGQYERKKNTLILVSSTAVLSLLTIFIIFMYRAFVRKKRDHLEIKIQKELVESKNREVRASITYAKRIQQAHLPSEKLVERTLTRLKK